VVDAETKNGDMQHSRHNLRVHLVSLNVVSQDAVSNDVMQMHSVLSDVGYASEIVALGTDKACRSLVQPFGSVDPAAWQPGTDVVIYHHSTGFPGGEALLNRTRASIVIRYHNVTPPGFFSGWSAGHVKACQEGVEASRRLARLPGAVFWGASSFNCSEMIAYGAPEASCRVLPPFHRIEELASEAMDRQMLAAYKDRAANILFVGGHKPNKGHANAIRVFATYQRLMNPRSRLIFAGSGSPQFEPYLASLRRLAAELGVAHRVVFLESISASQLRTLYFLADAFLCLSEHEGFCVPLAECMKLGVPIVAWGTTAVGETVGGCGLVWQEMDVIRMAESLHVCVSNPDVARELRKLAYEKYASTYSPEVLRNRLLCLVEEIEHMGAIPRTAQTTIAGRGER
jgi:glycosyltransferase involved in cell wall biosynthesis